MSGLPKGWVETTLGEVAKIKYGKDHKKLADGEFPLYGSGGIMRGVEAPLYHKPSILIPRKGTLTNLFYVDEPFWCVDTIFYTEIAEDNILPLFFFYKLKTINLAGKNVGSAVPSLTTKVLNPTGLTIPSLPEQKAIANILSSFDNKIELLREQNETLENLAQVLFKEWFVNFNYPNASGEMVDSEFGEIPEGWRVGKLGEVTTLRSGFAFKSKDFVDDSHFKVLKIKDLKGSGRVEIIAVSSVSEESPKSDRVHYFKLVAGDIVIAMSGNTTGKIGIVPEHKHSFKLYLNQRVGKLFFEDDAYRNFVYVFLMSGNYEAIISSMAYGSAQPNINPTQIGNIDFIIPDDAIFSQFTDIIGPIFEKIAVSNVEIETLSKTRDSLLPKLLNGSVRVQGFGE